MSASIRNAHQRFCLILYLYSTVSLQRQLFQARGALASTRTGPSYRALLDVPPQYLAQQLTIFNSDHFARIHPLELLYHFYPRAYHGTGDSAPNLKVRYSLRVSIRVSTQ
jgi:hypothetical protein